MPPAATEAISRLDSPSSAPLVRMQGITKRYPGCLANDSIDLALEQGRVHALLGENGAGKSTLVKILFGLLQCDSGHIEWQGAPVTIDSPGRARELGIAMVFQHFSLFDSLTVLENIALGMAVDANDELRTRIIDVSMRYGLPLDPDRSVYSLSVGVRQRIEICRCLLQEPRLLIMDEPTSVLTPQEVEQLFTTLRTLSEEGMAILYISHKLDEIRKLCHEATILRQGRKVASADPAEETSRSLAALMMGEELPDRVLASVVGASVDTNSTPAGMAVTKEADSSSSVLLRLDDLSWAARDGGSISLHSICLEAVAGEIIGIAGVAGNGQDELLSVIAGEKPALLDSAVMLEGKSVGHLGAAERRRRGLCCVPEERLGHAAVPDMTLSENAFLTGYLRQPLRKLGLVSKKRAKQAATTVIDRFKVACNGPSSQARSLSGGNLQKFIVGREILQSPSVLVVAQPTWGVDAGAAIAIHEALRELAATGSAIVIISQDLDELMSITSRIGALCAGRLSEMHPSESMSVHELGLLMGGQELSSDQNGVAA